MGHSQPKAFLPLAGTPMVVYSLRTLATLSGIDSLIVVVGAEQLDRAAEILHQHGPWSVPVRPVAGGAERQDSVAAGLAQVQPSVDLTAVHDAARPFVSLACVQACVDSAAAHGAAIVAMPAHDTVKVVGADHAITHTLDRRGVWLAQTPQVFRTTLLRQAYEQARRDAYAGTDDAMLMERTGHPVRVVPGEWQNRKITTPQDLEWAEWYVRTRSAG